MSIKWIHNNKRSLTVFIIATAVVLSMSLFGVDIPTSRNQRFAIKVGEEDISFDEFQREKRQRQQAMIEQYKQLFGDKYLQFASQIYNMPNQEIADDIIAKRLIIQEAKNLGLHVGEQELVNFINLQLFGGNFNSTTYAAYLSQVGMTAKGFEERLRRDLLIDSYRDLLSDFSEPSKREVETFAKQRETKYDVKYVEFDPKNFESKVVLEEPELVKFYEQNQTDYEIPANISYNFVDLNPNNSMDLVEISQDDIDFFYSENEERFMEPEALKVRHIQLNIPKDASKAKIDEVKAKAEEAHSKASAGEKFEMLVLQYSDDSLTAANGGSLGWLEKGKMDSRFDEAVFKLKTGEVSQLIETDYAYQIAKVDERKEANLKPLEEVRGEIEKELKTREAPAFISAKAHEIFAAWESDERTIEQMAKENNFQVEKADLLSAGTDPRAELRGLTEQAITQSDIKKQIIELGDRTILLEVFRFEDTKIPSFEDARQLVENDYKAKESRKLAKAAADSFVEKIKASNAERIELGDFTKAEGLTVQEIKSASRTQQLSGILASSDVQDAVFSNRQQNARPPNAIEVTGKFYVLNVSKIEPPKNEDIIAKFAEYKDQAKHYNSSLMIQANLNRLKANTEIDIDNSLLASGEL
jgi:peptidyl-prolyl cis-trans isomerase D